jgi:hypothetical protein
VSGLGQREQRMRCTAFDEDVRLDAGEAAGRIEGRANPEALVEQQERMCGERANVDVPAVPSFNESGQAARNSIGDRSKLAMGVAPGVDVALEADDNVDFRRAPASPSGWRRSPR